METRRRSPIAAGRRRVAPRGHGTSWSQDDPGLPGPTPVRVRQALIPAAGAGVRAYPKTTYMPKVLLRVDGVPLIQRNIELLRDALGIRDIAIITGYLGEQIRTALGDGSTFEVSLSYIECEDVTDGLARGILLARDRFREPFVTILGDELYLNSNHAEMRALFGRDCDAACAVKRTEDNDLIRRNYSIRIVDGAIAGLVEKPQRLENDLMGCGTYYFTSRIFDAIERTPPSPRSGRVELTDAIDLLAREGRVLPFELRGAYMNVNTEADYHLAQYTTRAKRAPDCTVSVVVPAFNEEASIGDVVRDFREHVTEVVVVDNSSTDRTAETARAAGARVETVKLRGYGDTIRHGLDVAGGDILVVVEADSSFRARDLHKLLEYLKDADMVVGTRTTRELIEQGTNMRGAVRVGNVVVAKLLELLWWRRRPRFTDVGCTYRALWRETYQRIRPLLRGVGPELSPEMMIAALQARLRIIEVPVSYHRRRAGASKHSANYLHISRTALRMLKTIARKRLERF